MRNYNMDFIRGVAVLGLVYMNAYAFGIFEYGYSSLTNPPVSDSIIHTLSSVFVDGRFRTLFSLLFGAGLYIQWQRYKSELQLKSRLSWLILFGLAHGFLALEDDTIFSYKCDNFYNKDAESGIIYNDTSIAIDWNASEKDFIISEKDSLLPQFKEVES